MNIIIFFSEITENEEKVDYGVFSRMNAIILKQEHSSVEKTKIFCQLKKFREIILHYTVTWQRCFHEIFEQNRDGKIP